MLDTSIDRVLVNSPDICLIGLDLLVHRAGFLKVKDRFYLLQSNQDGRSDKNGLVGKKFTLLEWLQQPISQHLKLSFSALQVHQKWLTKGEFQDFMTILKLGIKGSRQLLFMELFGAPYRGLPKTAACFVIPFDPAVL